MSFETWRHPDNRHWNREHFLRPLAPLCSLSTLIPCLCTQQLLIFFFFHLRLALFILPRRGITRSYGNHMFNFLGNAKRISKVTLSFYTPTSNNREFQGLHILVNT